MDYFFEHHAATLVFFVHQGGGALETLFGPIEYRTGDFLVVPKGIPHRFEPATGPQYYWVYESFAGDPEKAETPTTGRFITHSRSDYQLPALARHPQRGGPLRDRLQGRRASTRVACTRRIPSTSSAGAATICHTASPSRTCAR